MATEIEFAFEKEWIIIPLERLVPSKLTSPATKASKKYQQILDSVREAGLVEPIVVHPVKGRKIEYLIIDGHLRLEALKDLGREEAPCLIAKDDEAFTYNKRINRLGTVQEHEMILKAIKSGVPEDRIAKALGVTKGAIQRKKKMLDGICLEAVQILKHVRFSVETASVLKRMKPVRQIEAVELMQAMNNFSTSYARALLIATPPAQLVDPTDKPTVRGVSDTKSEEMEREMETLQRDIKAVEDKYGVNMLRLVVANGYIGRLLENSKVSIFLNKYHEEIVDQLVTLQESVDADMGVHAE